MRRSLLLIPLLIFLIGCGGQTDPATDVTSHSATLHAYYVSSSSGSDSNNGTDPSTPWQTLAKVNAATLGAGDTISFKRGDTWTGGVVIASDGTPASPITLNAYGDTGLALPKITGGLSGNCWKASGANVQFEYLDASACGYAGFNLFGLNDTVAHSTAEGNAAGTKIAGDYETASNNVLMDNNVENVNTPCDPGIPGSCTDDSGSFGVLVNGDHATVTHNDISGSEALSYDYGWDGAGTELFDASNAYIAYNSYTNDNGATEIGKSPNGDADSNTFEYNRVWHGAGPDTSPYAYTWRGDGSTYGPNTNTVIRHNSISLYGSEAHALTCQANCPSSSVVVDNAINIASGGGTSNSYALYIDNSGWIVTGNVLRGGITGTHPPLDSSNLEADPLFAADAGGDLRETAGSPGIDHAGSTPQPVDLDGASVPQDGDCNGSSLGDSGAYEYTCIPPPPTHVLAAVGDMCSTGCTGQGGASAATVRAINPERLLGLGDFQYQNAGAGGGTFIGGWQAVWGDLANKTAPVFGATHDTCDGSGNWECYPVRYFNANGAPEVQGGLSDHQWGYSFDMGRWHVVAFNDDTSLGGSVAQVTADLDAHPSQCLLASVHAPVWGSPSSEHPTNQAAAWAQTLIDHGADLALSGHQHFYERNIVGSTTSITEGEGGIGHYERSSIAPTAVAYNDTSFGVLKLTLGANSWSTEFIANAGAPAFTDTASGTCGA